MLGLCLKCSTYRGRLVHWERFLKRNPMPMPFALCIQVRLSDECLGPFRLPERYIYLLESVVVIRVWDAR
jgi:hypothetical protein